jgi:hypothetical protein
MPVNNEPKRKLIVQACVVNEIFLAHETYASGTQAPRYTTVYFIYFRNSLFWKQSVCSSFFCAIN